MIKTKVAPHPRVPPSCSQVEAIPKMGFLLITIRWAILAGDAYHHGYAGTCRVHWKQYLALRGLSTPVGIKPFLADPRVYCKVHEEVDI